MIGAEACYIDEFESEILTLESLVHSLLVGKEDIGWDIASFHSEVLKLSILTNRELKTEAVQIGKKLLSFFDSANLETNYLLNFKLMVTMLMFANDNESVDQGEIL